LDLIYAEQDHGFGLGDGFAAVSLFQVKAMTDGRIAVAGQFLEYDETLCQGVVILLPDGKLDTSFNAGTLNGIVGTLAIQTDGKILIAGSMTQVGGSPCHGLARLNVDGSLDPTFNIGAGTMGSIRTITIQPDGKILVGGQFTLFNGEPAGGLIRLNSDGSVDNTLDIGTGFNGYQDHEIKSLALQPDGKIIAGGSFFIFDNDTMRHIVRLNPDGSLDTGFDIGSGFERIGGDMSGTTGVVKVDVLPDGRIATGGGHPSGRWIARSLF
jgi:uncharacterized delta-60 repeat protein